MSAHEKPANMTDFDSRSATVALLFEDPTITHLFSELLRCRGVKTAVANPARIASSECKIITEPQYFELLSEQSRSHCMIVGNKESLPPAGAVLLSRPLTEHKIESALAQFLRC